jgi:archaemetzincin
LKENDVQLDRPKAGEWLHEHKEPGQTLNRYQAVHPVRATSLQNTIYLLPLGTFSKAQQNVIKYTADYLTLYFSLPTKVLPVLSDSLIPTDARRERGGGSVQLLAPYILDSVLKERIPNDALSLMAITEKDLYPKSSWSFVFGLATLKERVGVSSIHRYSREPIDSLNYPICLGRLISTSSHEIGHMLSMRHCTYAVCVMNGSNSLSESDSRPNRLCSQCLSKLHWNLGFDVRKRIIALDSFFIHHRLDRDYKAIHRDLTQIE